MAVIKLLKFSAGSIAQHTPANDSAQFLSLGIGTTAPSSGIAFVDSTPTTAGQMGMNATSGRPRCFINGASHELAHIDEISGSGAVGSAVVDFGSFPGTDVATVTVTGQTSLSSSNKPIAWIDPTQGATAAHSVDEHIMAVQLIQLSCTSLVVGTGFTIEAVALNGFLSGQFNVSWRW